MIKTITLCTIAAAFISGAFYIGMSRELCRRDNISPSEYQAMRLDCSFWLYR